jgi:glycosyltransferase involved in cell wall biosynthesis
VQCKSRNGAGDEGFAVRLAYVTTYDAAEIDRWSGLGSFIAKALSMAHLDIEYIKTPPPSPWVLWSNRARNVLPRLQGRRYLTTRNSRLARSHARYLEAQLAATDADIVFSPGSIPISLLDCLQPIVFWTDASFAAMLGFYPEYRNLSPASVREGNQMEQSALDRSRLAIYSSDWAAETARAAYQVDPGKIRVVPFGANIDIDHGLDDVRGFVRHRGRDTCRLLFAGVDWQRKGGDLVLRIAADLTARGIPVELDVLGCTPPVETPDYVRVHGFVSKSSPGGDDLIRGLFKQAHFLLLPSRAETYGVVFAEASAYGLPSLATRVGGIPTVVQDRKNGQTFSLDAPASAYADYVADLFARPADYEALALSSFAEYEARLNWGVAGRNVAALVEAIR